MITDDSERRKTIKALRGEGEIAPVDLPWRATPEWVGKTPDSRVPDRVKRRVFLRWGGICHLTGRKIQLTDKWDVEHVKPVRGALPGEPHRNRESNLRPALKEPHRKKTAQENSDGAKADRIWDKNHGLHKSKSRLSHPRLRKKMDGTVVPR